MHEEGGELRQLVVSKVKFLQLPQANPVSSCELKKKKKAVNCQVSGPVRKWLMIPVIDGGTYRFLLQTAAPDNFWKQSAFEVLRGARIQAEGGTACCWRCRFRVTWGGGEGSQGTGKAAAVHKDRCRQGTRFLSTHTVSEASGNLGFSLIW